MRRWLDRPGYVGVISFAGGAALAGVIVLVIVFVVGGNGDDDGGGSQVVATSTAGPLADADPAASGGTTGPGAATATAGGAQDPDEALEAFVEDELEAEYLGACPEELAEGETPPTGICSLELYRTEELATFLIGDPFSEFFGETIITRSEDGSWSVNFIADSNGDGIEVGIEAVVYGAGSCLRFREEPGLSAEVVSCQIDGRTGQVAEGPEDADEITWWRLDGLGWASGEFLRPTVGD